MHGAIAIANTIAYLSEMVDPISIFLSLTRRDLTRQAFRFLLLGEGEPGLLVYAILLRYWSGRRRTTCGRGSTSCRTERARPSRDPRGETI